MQYVIRVDGPGDVKAFVQSMRDQGLAVGDLLHEREWLESVKASREPHDAEYLSVDAPSKEAIDAAVEATSRYADWPQGAPVFTVLGERERPTYPAHGADQD
ncbi:hypothetical protein [Nocardioides sp. Leaf374]|uniref:hypothetical protein n=1 Tax=Nocardioides sp. Leaf374 TaxID=2876560 RepID=UPI001E60D5E7|nr:hypothetical protein [Nocardioides sp. Leaf374]